MDSSPQMDGILTVAGIIALLVAAAVAAFGLWMNTRILNKAGYSGWWCLITLVPIVNVVMIWVFAFADWPRLKKAE
jgi:uncharacterized membrane protein YhaH (DUF805 family)